MSNGAILVYDITDEDSFQKVNFPPLFITTAINIISIINVSYLSIILATIVQSIFLNLHRNLYKSTGRPKGIVEKVLTLWKSKSAPNVQYNNVLNVVIF